MPVLHWKFKGKAYYFHLTINCQLPSDCQTETINGKHPLQGPLVLHNYIHSLQHEVGFSYSLTPILRGANNHSWPAKSCSNIKFHLVSTAQQPLPVLQLDVPCHGQCNDVSDSVSMEAFQNELQRLQFEFLWTGFLTLGEHLVSVNLTN